MKYKINLDGRTVDEIEDLMTQREIYDYCREKKVRLRGIDIHKAEAVYSFVSERGDTHGKAEAQK